MALAMHRVRPAEQFFRLAMFPQCARAFTSFSSSTPLYKSSSVLYSGTKHFRSCAFLAVRHFKTSSPLCAEKPAATNAENKLAWSNTVASAVTSTPVKPSFTHIHEKGQEDLDGIYMVPHFRHDAEVAQEPEADLRLPHPVWSRHELENQVSPHHKPRGLVDRAAYITVKTLRVTFDVFTGYALGLRSAKCYLRRVIFLETVAGVPGMVGAMNRHLSSLRTMQRDFGWIHTLLEEAENERMHLMIALCLRQPSLTIRLTVLLAQAIFLSWYTIMYTLSHKYCHRFVGYLEEEAFKTYTSLVECIDSGNLKEFETLAPTAVQKYYRLGANGTLRDVFLAMRAGKPLIDLAAELSLLSFCRGSVRSYLHYLFSSLF